MDAKVSGERFCTHRRTRREVKEEAGNILYHECATAEIARGLLQHVWVFSTWMTVTGSRNGDHLLAALATQHNSREQIKQL